MEDAEVKINDFKDIGNMEKNYFHIEGMIELSDFFNALPILQEEGILLILGIIDSEVIKKLEKFKVLGVKFPNTGRSITFGIFKVLKEKNLAIKFNNESRSILYELSKEITPDIEICSYVYYLNNEKDEILEYAVGRDIFISRKIIKNDNIVRLFCKKIGINRYCLEEFVD